MDLRRLFRRTAKPYVAKYHTKYASMNLASAPIDGMTQPPSSSSDWQKKVWQFYEVVPEVQFVVEYRSAALSKVGLQLAVATPDGKTEPFDGPQATEILDRILGGPAHHADSLMRYAQHLTLVGETYTVVIDPEGDGNEEWLILPPDHIDFTKLYTTKVNGRVEQRGTVTITHPLTGKSMEFDPNSGRLTNFRMWNPHPHYFWEANSTHRGAVSTLEKIQNLDGAINSAAISRLTGGGVWFLPQELRQSQKVNTKNGAKEEEEFDQTLYKAVTESIKNPRSASRVAPIISWVPGDLLEKIREPFKFWSDFDKSVKELRDVEIRRYATGQPIPTEMVTGLGDVNHWTGWHLSEEDLKFDIAPLAQMICDTLTVQIIQPLLGNTGLLLVPDFSELATRPNRAPEALEFYKEGAISRSEVRVAGGWPSDFPADEQPELGTEEGTSESSRNEPPDRPDSPEEAQFAVADLLCRDIVGTAGQWILTHSGRDKRTHLSAISPGLRHVTFGAGREVLDEVVTRVRPKYEGSVDEKVFTLVCDHVLTLFNSREPYDPAKLKARICGVHSGTY